MEPGPVVLLTTASGDQRNVMSMSWHSMLEFEPPLIGCVVSDRNHSCGLLTASNECVINIPSVDIAGKVVRCGNSTGRRTDKFKNFGLTPRPGNSCRSPADRRVLRKPRVPRCRHQHGGEVWILCPSSRQGLEDPAVKHPRTIHHLGRGSFMVAGETIKLPSRMK